MRYVEGGWVAGLVTPTRPNSNDEFLDFGSPSTLASQKPRPDTTHDL